MEDVFGWCERVREPGEYGFAGGEKEVVNGVNGVNGTVNGTANGVGGLVDRLA